MPLPRQLLQIDFDQFHRYAAVTVLLKPLLEVWSRTSTKPLRLLEVGSHALNLLPAFLAPIPIEIVRADLEPQYAGDLGPYVTLQGDEPLPFEDNAFDVTVAMEVLEHIPAEDRRFALSEWARVAQRGVIFTCPNGKRVRKLEARADADFQARHGRVHPWLEEHERFGWPSRVEVESLCETLGLTCHRLLNSPLAEWLPLLLATEQIFEKHDQELFHRFNQMLNMRPFRAFIQEPGYRSIYAAFKSEKIDHQARSVWSGLPEMREPAKKPIDATRTLARQLSQFILKNRRHEVDGNRLQQLERENAELRKRLERDERLLVCQRWQSQSRRTFVISDNNPLRQARLIDLEPFGPAHWQIVGEQPSLTWTCHHARGWHRLTLRGWAAVEQSALISIDYGHGFRGEHDVALGTWNEEGCDERWVHVYFHHPVVGLRLRVKAIPSPLVVESLSIEPRSTMQVACAGIGRLVQDLYHFPRQTWPLLKSPASLVRQGMQRTQFPKGLAPAAPTSYQSWLQLQRPTQQQRTALVEQHCGNKSKFVFFLRVPADLNLEDWQHTLESLRALDSSHWELWCAARPTHQQRLASNAFSLQLGKRLRWMYDGNDRGLAGLLHDCIDLSQAKWLMLLEPGDQLEPDSVLQFLDAARQHPQVGLLVADEDLILPDEGLGQPIIKPKLMPETLRYQPRMAGGALVIECNVLDQLGGFNPTYDGALVEEYIQRLLHAGLVNATGQQQPGIVPVPRVLLHRPVPSEPTVAQLKVLERMAEDYSSKASSIETHRVEVNEDLVERRGLAQEIRHDLISIIIPSAGRVTEVNGQPLMHLERCLKHLRAKTTYPHLEVLVVDQGNLPEHAVQVIHQHQAQRISLPGSFNFSRSINRAAQAAKGTLLLLLNDDTEVITPDWLEQLSTRLHEGVGAVGAKLFFPTGQLQHVGITLKEGLPMHPYYGKDNVPGYLNCCQVSRNWLAVTAACLLTPRKIFEELHGFDESFELNYNDVDYCLRLWQAGYRVVMNPQVELYHHEAMRTDGRAAYRPEELARFRQRWAQHYFHDPFFPRVPGQEGAC